MEDGYYIENVRDLARNHARLYSESEDIPIDIFAIAFRMGIRVRLLELPEDPDFTGAGVHDDDGYNSVWLSINPNQKLCQRRWTLAHEIGHMMLEHPCPCNEYHELAAEIYAETLLLPEPLVTAQVREYRKLEHDKQCPYHLALADCVPEVKMETRLERLGLWRDTRFLQIVKQRVL